MGSINYLDPFGIKTPMTADVTTLGTKIFLDPSRKVFHAHIMILVLEIMQGDQ